MISLWFSHSFHVSRLRRLRHDIFLWTAMVPLVMWELVMGGYESLTSKYGDFTSKTLLFLQIASFCSIKFCGGMDVLTLINQLLGFLWVSDHLDLGKRRKEQG